MPLPPGSQQPANRNQAAQFRRGRPKSLMPVFAEALETILAGVLSEFGNRFIMAEAASTTERLGDEADSGGICFGIREDSNTDPKHGESSTSDPERCKNVDIPCTDAIDAQIIRAQIIKKLQALDPDRLRKLMLTVESLIGRRPSR